MSASISGTTNWFQPVILAITTVGVCTQLYLLHLVFHASTPGMCSYRFFLVNLSTYEIALTVTVGYLLRPEFISADIAGSWVHGWARWLDPAAWNASVCAALFFGTGVILATDYALLYRYVAVRQDGGRLNRLFMHPACIGAFMTFSVCMDSVSAWLYYKTMVPSDERIDYLRRMYGDSLVTNPDYVAVVEGAPSIFVNARSKWLLFNFAYLGVGMALSEAVSCGIAILVSHSCVGCKALDVRTRVHN
jgi:Serpentine type 7TM GPCR chemoreceptor Str